MAGDERSVDELLARPPLHATNAGEDAKQEFRLGVLLALREGLAPERCGMRAVWRHYFRERQQRARYVSLSACKTPRGDRHQGPEGREAAPSAALEEREEIARLLSFVRPKVRELYRLRFVEGLSMKEVAARLKTTSKGVRNRLLREQWRQWWATT